MNNTNQHFLLHFWNETTLERFDVTGNAIDKLLECSTIEMIVFFHAENSRREHDPVRILLLWKQFPTHCNRIVDIFESCSRGNENWNDSRTTTAIVNLERATAMYHASNTRSRYLYRWNELCSSNRSRLEERLTHVAIVTIFRCPANEKDFTLIVRSCRSLFNP